MKIHALSSLKRAAAALGLVVAGAGLGGCAAQDVDEAGATASAETANAEHLEIPLERSPSGGASFTFCANPTPGAPLMLTNAAWLAMASANEYANLGYFAPQLLALGFGKPNGADQLWTQCSIDLGKLRDFETAHASELQSAKNGGPGALVEYMRKVADDGSSFGACARKFLTGGAYTGRDVDAQAMLPAAAFREFLVRQTHDDNWIQFFSGRPYSFIERWLGRGSTQVMMARHATKPIVIVSFRGSEPPSSLFGMTARQAVDLVTDVLAWKTDLTTVGFSPGWGSAHNGWVSSLQSVDDLTAPETSLLSSKLAALTENDDKIGIWVTGHSLGGAVATLLAARILDAADHGAKFNLRGLYTFGAPIVGNKEFGDQLVARAAAHGTHIVRFRRQDDVVTSVPFSPTGRYRHAGTLAFLTGSEMRLLGTEPGYGSRNFNDHDLSGPSGYYQQLLTQIRSGTQPTLDSCESRPDP